jgi:hypothetical protein
MTSVDRCGFSMESDIGEGPSEGYDGVDEDEGVRGSVSPTTHTP